MSKDWTGNAVSMFKTLGASNHAAHERQAEDYYATEPKATEWLCKLESFKGPILEPSCGEGHIANVLMAHHLAWRHHYQSALQVCLGVCAQGSCHYSQWAQGCHVPKNTIS